jgi:hypothetical protein
MSSAMNRNRRPGSQRTLYFVKSESRQGLPQTIPASTVVFDGNIHVKLDESLLVPGSSQSVVGVAVLRYERLGFRHTYTHEAQENIFFVNIDGGIGVSGVFPSTEPVIELRSPCKKNLCRFAASDSFNSRWATYWTKWAAINRGSLARASGRFGIFQNRIGKTQLAKIQRLVFISCPLGEGVVAVWIFRGILCACRTETKCAREK